MLVVDQLCTTVKKQRKSWTNRAGERAKSSVRSLMWRRVSEHIQFVVYTGRKGWKLCDKLRDILMPTTRERKSPSSWYATFESGTNVALCCLIGCALFQCLTNFVRVLLKRQCVWRCEFTANGQCCVGEVDIVTVTEVLVVSYVDVLSHHVIFCFWTSENRKESGEMSLDLSFVFCLSVM